MRKLKYADSAGERLTHYLFRYPAKFHPPVVKSLISTYTKAGQTILDPFVGSGTLLVEAVSAERNAVGFDVDPIAVAVSEVKSRRYRPSSLQETADFLLSQLDRHERSESEYEERMFVDLARHKFSDQARALRKFIPAIPNIEHWFRRYVIIDLAKIFRQIHRADMSSRQEDFFCVVFASIIRNSSNADPVPVSGLEVTSHMKRKDEKGRLINPFLLFKRAIKTSLAATREFYESTSGDHEASVYQTDATSLQTFKGHFDAVITSPPYQGAVDYYRRHKLEMFWLQQTESQEDRLALLRKYVGRISVTARENNAEDALGRLATCWEKRIAGVSNSRARSFRHYIVSMGKVLNGLSEQMRKNAPAIFVLGDSKWNGIKIPTRALFEEIAGNKFRLDEVFFYPIKNRYMSYSRHNGADIKKEFVLVLRRN